MQELIPFAYASIGVSLDILTTYIGCKKFGTRIEKNDITRNLMNEKGIFKGVSIKWMKDQRDILGIGIGCYALDSVLGIEKESFNFHKTWLYGWGSIFSLAALWNAGNGIYGYFHFKKLSKKNK